MELLFQDIVYQLGSQKAQAIEELCEVSRKVLENIVIVDNQVGRGMIN
nr:hypothetical protein [Peribacillus glennii]